ncbi:MAG: YidC/Oxa1 family membrane protein insertase [Patescibacteria group bacterium]
MSYLYNLIFYNPLLNTLVVLYQTAAFGDLGVAIILLTILVRLVLFPVFQRTTRDQMVMQKIQPQLKKIQEDHRGDREKQSQATLAVWREHKVNPFSSFFLMILQVFILIALYQIFLGLNKTDALAGLYSFVSKPENINPNFLGLINLYERNIVIVVLAAIAQYFQGRFSLIKPKPGQEVSAAQKMNERMMWMFTGLTIVILWGLPSAAGLYWLTTSIFSVGQQIIIRKQLQKDELGGIRKKTD